MSMGTIRRELRDAIVELLKTPAEDSPYQVATYLPNYSDDALYQYVKGKTTGVPCLFISQPSIKATPFDTVSSMANAVYEIRIVMTTPQGVKLAQIPDEKPDTDDMLDFIHDRLVASNPISLQSAGVPRTAYIAEFSELFTDDTIDVAQCIIQFEPITLDFSP